MIKGWVFCAETAAGWLIESGSRDGCSRWIGGWFCELDRLLQEEASSFVCSEMHCDLVSKIATYGQEIEFVSNLGIRDEVCNKCDDAKGDSDGLLDSYGKVLLSKMTCLDIYSLPLGSKHFYPLCLLSYPRKVHGMDLNCICMNCVAYRNNWITWGRIYQAYFGIATPKVTFHEGLVLATWW